MMSLSICASKKDESAVIKTGFVTRSSKYFTKITSSFLLYFLNVNPWGNITAFCAFGLGLAILSRHDLDWPARQDSNLRSTESESVALSGLSHGQIYKYDTTFYSGCKEKKTKSQNLFIYIPLEISAEG